MIVQHKPKKVPFPAYVDVQVTCTVDTSSETGTEGGRSEPIKAACLGLSKQLSVGNSARSAVTITVCCYNAQGGAHRRRHEPAAAPCCAGVCPPSVQQMSNMQRWLPHSWMESKKCLTCSKAVPHPPVQEDATTHRGNMFVSGGTHLNIRHDATGSCCGPSLGSLYISTSSSHNCLCSL